MFSGGDKYSGTLAGASRGREQEAEASTDPMQALATMGCDDSLRVLVDAEDEHGNPVQVPAVISARIDADGGGIRWTQEEDEEAAVNAAMGASQMASMLHDTGRIRAFERAIEGAVARFRAAHGRGPVVLDIGAGTGLLSMLAARAGAAAVFACEMYEPMARVARRVVADNGMTPPWLGESSGASGASFESKAAAVDATATAASTADGGGAPAGCPVTVFAKLSTALTVGSASPAEVASAAAAAWSAPAGADARHPPLLAASATDLPCRCDLLVTEILDSALLGEGMLRSGALQIAEWNFSSAGTASSAERMSLPAAETPLAGADCALLWWEALIGVDADGTDVTYCTRPRHPAVAADPLPLRPSFAAAGSVFGFNHAAFDSMRAGWNRARVLSFPLWMYEAAVVSEPATLFALDCSRGAGDGGPRIAGPDKRSVAEALGTLKGAADAVAVWTELDLTGESLLDPAKAPHWDVGEQPSVGWDSTAWVRAGSPLTFARQEVFVLDTTLEAGKRVPWDVQLDLESGKGLVFTPAGI
ncbi:hypothetical protein FNF27_04231 [Cafeteria roenbergensis]|uniref:Protein arginine N-methyltransferase n=1 Tax=Cafeteria roenbergensis TaxID=33653 RepID=A0A5A8E9K6_CAFRO|nr:hypothetical protein FNF27_04231 [Cafeteria roenbergensis]